MQMRIAIAGKLRSGKSAAARYLAEEYGFERVSFGAELKRFAGEIFGASEAKPRRLYQHFGQAMREIDENVWIRHVEKRIESLGRAKGIVIDDLRQPNEYRWARANGFFIVSIAASEDTRLARAKAAGDDFSIEDLRHDTEIHVDSFTVDFEIWNDGDDLAELERRVGEIIDEIKERID